MMSNPLNIHLIQEVSVQGVTEPFLCVAEDKQEYFVKGLNAGRKSQINEWICANIAQALGLPIAPFALVNIPEELFEELPSNQKKIGMGIAFGSQAMIDQVHLSSEHLHDISRELQAKIAAFDWLIHNMDRTDRNPNLLFQPDQKQLTIIDHNLAFDQNFDKCLFCECHIFRDAFLEYWHDLDHQDKIIQWIQQSVLNAYQQACQTLPPEWHYINLEQDIPISRCSTMFRPNA